MRLNQHGRAATWVSRVRHRAAQSPARMGGQREEEVLTIGPALSRRGFFGAVGVLGTITATGPAAASLLAPGPVVSFHRDAPYLDPTGTGAPYRSRIATDWADDLDDEALIRLGVIH